MKQRAIEGDRILKKISLMIDGKRYTITLEEPFADAVEKELMDLLDLSKDNDAKILLQALLTKQIECLELEERLNEILSKLSDLN
jgi:predicted DNA-binding ribbon-helix-helix protein